MLLKFTGIALAAACLSAALLARPGEAQEAAVRIVEAGPLPPDEPRGERPYEMERAGRQPERQPLLSFDSLERWTLECENGAAGEIHPSRRQRLWDSPVARLVYRGASSASAVTLRPPAPMEIAGPASAAAIWIHGNNWAWAPEPGTPPVTVSLLLLDREDERVLDLARVGWKEWWLVHKVLPPALRGKMPLRLAGIRVQSARRRRCWTGRGGSRASTSGTRTGSRSG